MNFDPITIAREIFGLTLPTKRAELKSSYRRLVRRFHPDYGGTNEDFIVVQRAYEILLAHPITFVDSLRMGWTGCAVCKGTGYAFFHADLWEVRTIRGWEPKRPCFTCFACRSTFGCQKCIHFKVTKSPRKAYIICEACRGRGDRKITKELPAIEKELNA